MSWRPQVNAALSDLTSKKEVALQSNAQAKIEAFGIPIKVTEPDLTMINPGGQPSTSIELGWLGKQPGCQGTTDFHAAQPSLWICSIYFNENTWQNIFNCFSFSGAIDLWRQNENGDCAQLLNELLLD